MEKAHNDEIEYSLLEEGIEHLCTWMGFPSSTSIWGSDLKGVQKNIALIAKIISKYEPVSILVNSDEQSILLEQLLDSISLESNYKITPIIKKINDLWLRDTGPIFVKHKLTQSISAIDFNFNGWGNKQAHDLDSQVAKFICNFTNTKRIVSKLVLEGGAIEVDGEGTAILMESCIRNNNRNPGLDISEIETELKRTLGLTKIIWLPGIKSLDITDGHVDFYVRFVGTHQPATVLVHIDHEDPETENNFSILKGSTDAKGRPLKVIRVVAPRPNMVRRSLLREKDTAMGYLNYYICNNAIILPGFGDQEADDNAFDILSENYSNRVIEQINIDFIALGGGGIHCTTQQQPKI